MSADVECYLYRHRSADGELLYIGISLSHVIRLSQHKDHSHWFKKIARVDIEAFPSRQTAVEAERLAIQAEHPKHNIHHRKMVNEEKKASRENDSSDSLTASIVKFDVLYKAEELPLPLSKKQIRELMDTGKLAFVEFPNQTNTKLKRFVSGWQLIDFLESIHAKRIEI